MNIHISTITGHMAGNTGIRLLDTRQLPRGAPIISLAVYIIYIPNYPTAQF
jgi:hypothetical protein